MSNNYKINTHRLIINRVTEKLKNIFPKSNFCDELILGTGITESKFIYLKQDGGPALSYYQIEPFTHNSLWKNYLYYRPQIAKEFIKIAGEYLIFEFLEEENHESFCKRFIEMEKYIDFNNRLVTNIEYSIAVCRLVYWTGRDQNGNGFSMPSGDFDLEKAAKIWKTFYNKTGKGTVEKYINDYKYYTE